MKQLSLLLVLILSMVACNSGDPGAENGEASKDKRRFLSVGTAPPGGTFFIIGGAMAQVANDHKGELKWDVNAESTSGSQENIRRLTSQELDFAVSNAAITYFAVRGEGIWKTPHEVRNVMTLAPNVGMFITPKSSGVKTLADLKGKRVVVGPSGAGFEHFLKPVLEAHGVNYDDFTPLHATQAGAVDLLADGSAAAAFLGGGVPTASITQACSTQDIHFIPFELPAREQLVKDFPFFGPITIKSGTYSDLTDAFDGMIVGAMHLITSAKTDDDVVYQMTKLIYENRNDVIEKHPAGRAINAANVIKNTGTEFHPGAIRYYKEIGIWPTETAAGAN